MLLCGSPNVAISCVQAWDVGGSSSGDMKSWAFCISTVGLRCAPDVQHTLPH